MKAFPKTEQKVLTVTIDENGDLIYLKTSEHDIFAELGEVITRRASHVEPLDPLLRFAFRVLRLFGDKTRVAEWTRGWECLWIVDTRPVGGPILRNKDVYDWCPPTCANHNAVATFAVRQNAIDAEIIFLNKFFLERGI